MTIVPHQESHQTHFVKPQLLIPKLTEKKNKNKTNKSIRLINLIKYKQKFLQIKLKYTLIVHIQQPSLLSPETPVLKITPFVISYFGIERSEVLHKMTEFSF